MTIRKFSFEIEGLFKASGEIELSDSLINGPSPLPDPEPINPPNIIPNPSNPAYVHLGDYDTDTNTAFQRAFLEKDQVLEITEKTYITDYIAQEPKLKAIVVREALVIGDHSNSLPGVLCLFESENVDFGIVGNVYQPLGHRHQTMSQAKKLFEFKPGKVKNARLAYLDSRCPSKDHLGWAAFGYIYSSGDSRSGNMIDLITSNNYYCGDNWEAIKTNNGNNIRYFQEYFDQFNPIIRAPKTHFYTPTDILVAGRVSNEVFSITSDNTISQVATWHKYEDHNIRTIINIGQAVFNISEEVIIDDKSLRLNPVLNGDLFTHVKTSDYDDVSSVYPTGRNKGRVIASSDELQPGDITSIGTVVEKQINNNRTKFPDFPGGFPRWFYVMDRETPAGFNTSKMIKSTFDQSSEIQPAYLVYKYNALMATPFFKADTEFGAEAILQSGGTGWSGYSDREFERFMYECLGSGFGRLSAGVGPQLIWHLKNVTGFKGPEWKIPGPYDDQAEFPKEIRDHCNYLRSL